MLKYLLSLFIFLCWFQSATYAQDSISENPTIHSTIKAKKYKIFLITNNTSIGRSLDSLSGNILYFSSKKGSQQVSIKLIKQLSVAKKRRQTLEGLSLGILGGVVSGAIIGRLSYVEPDPNAYHYFEPLEPKYWTQAGAMVGCLGGALVGTIMGVSSYKYKHHDFTKVPLAERHKLMSDILLEK